MKIYMRLLSKVITTVLYTENFGLIGVNNVKPKKDEEKKEEVSEFKFNVSSKKKIT